MSDKWLVEVIKWCENNDFRLLNEIVFHLILVPRSKRKCFKQSKFTMATTNGVTIRSKKNPWAQHEESEECYFFIEMPIHNETYVKERPQSNSTAFGWLLTNNNNNDHETITVFSNRCDGFQRKKKQLRLQSVMVRLWSTQIIVCQKLPREIW